MKKYKFNDESKVINIELPTLKSLAKKKALIQTFLGLLVIFSFSIF